MRNADQWRPSKFVYRRGSLIASRDSREVARSSRLMVDRVAHYYDVNLRQHARGTLVDLGCGKVPLFGAYADLVGDVVCVDRGPSGVNAHLDVECDLNDPLPFADNTFDTIIPSDVLEHIARPELLWSEMARILANEGTILMNVPFYYWIHAAPHDYYRYTEFALQRFVVSSGLDLIRLDAIGGAPEVLADILAKNIERVPLVGSPAALAVQSLTKVFCATRPGERVGRATRGSFPFGYFLIARKPA